MLHASELWLSNKSFKNADSLASASHKMIDHLWRDRSEIATLLIETGKPAVSRIEKQASALERYEEFRTVAKAAISRLKRLFGR